MERSQLLMPGPRKTSLGALPMVPTAGAWKTPVLKYCRMLRWSLAKTAFPVTTTREPSPPPVTSAPLIRL